MKIMLPKLPLSHKKISCAATVWVDITSKKYVNSPFHV